MAAAAGGKDAEVKYMSQAEWIKVRLLIRDAFVEGVDAKIIIEAVVNSDTPHDFESKVLAAIIAAWHMDIPQVEI